MWLSVMAIFLVYAVVFILFEDYNRKFVMPFNEVSDWQLLVFSSRHPWQASSATPTPYWKAPTSART